MLKLGFIGAGTAGTALSVRLSSKGYHVAAVSSRSQTSARNLAQAINGCRAFNSTQDVADIAAYYSMLPMMSGSGDLTDVGKMGKDLFFSNNCNFCHNDYDDNADIYIRKTARVGGQNKEYLHKSLKDIQEGIRRADTYNLMKRVLSQLTDDEIDALAEFLSVL